MNDVALQKQIDKLTNELRLAGDTTQGQLEELRASVDRIKLEIAALQMYLDSTLDSFSEEIPRFREQARLEVNPDTD